MLNISHIGIDIDIAIWEFTWAHVDPGTLHISTHGI